MPTVALQSFTNNMPIRKEHEIKASIHAQKLHSNKNEHNWHHTISSENIMKTQASCFKTLIYNSQFKNLIPNKITTPKLIITWYVQLLYIGKLVKKMMQIN